MMILIWRFGDCGPNLMYTNTTYNHVSHEAMYSEYRLIRKTKISDNVHYDSICQTYCLPNIQCIPYSCGLFQYWTDVLCIASSITTAVKYFCDKVTKT